MMKKIFIAFCLLVPIVVFGQAHLKNYNSLAHIEKYIDLSTKEKYSAATEVLRSTVYDIANPTDPLTHQFYKSVTGSKVYRPDAIASLEFIADTINYHPVGTQSAVVLGKYYFERQKYDKAATYYGKANQSQSLPESDKFNYAYSLFISKDVTKSTEIFSELANSNHPNKQDALYYLGFLYYRNKEYQKAYDAYNKINIEHKFGKDVAFSKLACLYQLGKWDELESNAKSVIDKGDASPDVYLYAAEATFKKNSNTEAFEFYSKSNIDKRNEAIKLRYSITGLKTENFDKVEELLKNVALSDDSIGSEASYYLGLGYLEKNNAPFAISAFQKTIKSKQLPHLAEQAYFYLGQLSFNQSNYSSAIISFDSLLTHFPETKYRTQTEEMLTEAYIHTNDLDKAMAFIEASSRKSPRMQSAYQRIHFLTAIKWFNQSDFEKAIDYLQKSLRYPSDKHLIVTANYLLGESYAKTNKAEEARERYLLAQSSGETENIYYYQSYYGLAYLLFNQEKYSEAAVQFKLFLDNNKLLPTPLENTSDAHLKLADCYYATKNFTKAISTYDDLVANKHPEIDYVMYQKATCLRLSNRVGEAKSLLKVLTEQYKNSNYVDDALLQLAQIELEEGNNAGAVAMFTELINQFPSSPTVPYALIKRGTAQNNIGQHQNAAKDFAQVIDDFPRSPYGQNALIGLQDATSKSGDQETFNLYLEKFKTQNPENTSFVNVEFDNAKNMYFLAKYDKALKLLNDYLNNYPNSPYKIDVLFYLGETYYRKQNMPRAKEYHTEVMLTNQQPLLEKSLRRLADIAIESNNYREAIGYANQILKVTNSKKNIYMAYTTQMQAYYKLELYDSASYYADAILEKGNATISAQNMAMLYKGKILFTNEKYADAIDELLSVINTTRDENAAEAQYLIAKSLFLQKKYRESLESLYELNKNFAQFNDWYDKSFLLIADNFIALNEFYRAQATLKTIVEKSPNKSIREEASKKLESIRLQTNKSSQDSE